MKCNKVNTILRMKSNHIDKILCCQCRKISLVMNHTIIHRNCSNHRRTFTCQLLTEWLCISMTGKIHNCLCPKLNRTHYLLHLNVVIFTISGYSKIYINFGSKHTSDSFRVETGMFFICTNCHLSFCH